MGNHTLTHHQKAIHMERAAKMVIRVKKKSKTKFKVVGIKSETKDKTEVTIMTDAPDFIEGVYSRLPDDIVSDVEFVDQFDDVEEL